MKGFFYEYRQNEKFLLQKELELNQLGVSLKRMDSLSERNTYRISRGYILKLVLRLIDFFIAILGSSEDKNQKFLLEDNSLSDNEFDFDGLIFYDSKFLNVNPSSNSKSYSINELYTKLRELKLRQYQHNSIDIYNEINNIIITIKQCTVTLIQRCQRQVDKLRRFLPKVFKSDLRLFLRKIIRFLFKNPDDKSGDDSDAFLFSFNRKRFCTLLKQEIIYENKRGFIKSNQSSYKF
jgi:hypothetical protein